MRTFKVVFSHGSNSTEHYESNGTEETLVDIDLSPSSLTLLTRFKQEIKKQKGWGSETNVYISGYQEIVE